jgi:hypothetical protein
MNKLLAVGAVALLVVVVGLVTGGGGDDRLLGTWEVDEGAVKDMPQFKGADEFERDMALQVLKSMKIRIVITEDQMKLGGPLAAMADGKVEVPYRVVESDDSSVTVELDQNGKWKKQVFRFQGDGRMTVPQDGRSLPLRRVSR